LLFGDELVAKPAWASFFGQHQHPVLERFWDLESNGAPADRLAGSRFLQHVASVIFPASGPAVDAVESPAGMIAAPAPLGESNAWADQPVFATGTPAVETIADSAAHQTGTVQFGGGNMSASSLTTVYADAAANFAVLYSDDFQSALVMNSLNKTLLEGGPGNFPELGQGSNDTLELSGDFSSGFALPSQPAGLDRIVVRAGDDYSLVSGDDNVAPGQTLTVDAMPLAKDGHILFDGSAETDGSFVFFGSGQADVFIGGAGDDRILGNGGADMLNGGGGHDTFVYFGASESTGPDYDMLGDFTAGVDHIDLPGTVAGFAATVGSGSLSTASFNEDLGALLGGLGAGQAAWVAPDSGDLAGKTFLVVDANGIPGYQPGEDYVFGVEGSTLADLTGHTDIFV
jgi:Ca2+-binding RTX toxin-like protein